MRQYFLNYFRVVSLQAGTYNAVAEYTESRPELLAGMSKKEVVVRSATMQFVVMPGDPVALGLGSNGGVGPLPEKIMVTNGPNSRQRTLVRAVAVQLHDMHGNAAPVAGVQLRFCIRMAEGIVPSGGAVLPCLQVVEGLTSWETDAAGKAFAGDLVIEQGSGERGEELPWLWQCALCCCSPLNPLNRQAALTNPLLVCATR